MPKAQKSTTPPPLIITSLERTLWPGLRADLDVTLDKLRLAHLSSPTMLIMHDLIDFSVRAMHRKVFLKLAEDDFGMAAEGNEENVEGLYNAEVAEHGSQNIAQYCKQHGWHVVVNFPREENTILSITIPVKCEIYQSSSLRLVEALGFKLDVNPLHDAAGGFIVTLKKQANSQSSVRSATLLDNAASLNSVQRIYEKLGYGIILFSSAGEVLSLSRSMLESVKLPANEASIARFIAAIPFNFYNDIIWSLTLSGQKGIFENYRIRMGVSGKENLSILFNVSGYQDEQSIFHSLWQIVSFTHAGKNLGEGSILSEARVNKITRNYVPQLVEEKAREAVRLGKDKLTNEERAVAVLFCDIVGFTSYVESNASSESIINTLNTILRRVSGSVKRFDGSIDKFMGDSVMAIFRDPANAIYAALDMQSHSADINNLRSRAGQDTLRLRIGIHWGNVVIGNVGTEERLDWTAIGDVVNTASRIEKNCHPGSILISQAMRDVIFPMQHPGIQFSEVFTIMVKGKREALPVCHIKHPDEKSDI
jgi:adenylate cyclase